MRVAFQGIEGPRSGRNHVFDDSCSLHYAEIAGGLSTDDNKRGGVFNLVDGANVASLFKGAGTERGSFLCNDLLETFAFE